MKEALLNHPEEIRLIRRVAELEAALKQAENHAETLRRQLESLAKEVEDIRPSAPPMTQQTALGGGRDTPMGGGPRVMP